MAAAARAPAQAAPEVEAEVEAAVAVGRPQKAEVEAREAGWSRGPGGRLGESADADKTRTPPTPALARAGAAVAR